MTCPHCGNEAEKSTTTFFSVVWTKAFLALVLALLTNVVRAQDVSNDTIYDMDDIEWQWRPDLRTVSDYKRGTGWRKFIEKFAEYPSKALQNGISGTSVVSVVIYKDGSKGKPEIVQSSDSLLDAEALRVVSLMPEFKKGYFNVRMRMPVHFLIHGDLKSEITTREDKQPKEYKIDGYFGCYFGFSMLDYPDGDDYAFLETDNPFVNGVLEMYGGHIFRNDKKLAFSIGGGFRYWHYSFARAFSLRTDHNRVYGDSLTRENDKFRWHCLRVINLSAPLGAHFRFNSKKDNKCEFSLWLLGNMRIGCREKQIYEALGAVKKVKIKDDFLVRRFSYDLALEFTCQCGSARVTYTPSSFFKKDVKPNAHSIILSLGFKFGGGQEMM